jgi:hypothetical protein
MAIDMLIPREPSAFPNSVYLIGLAKGWIFEKPFETYPIDVGGPVTPDSQAPLDPEEVEAEFGRIVKLLKEQRDADSASTQHNRAASS